MHLAMISIPVPLHSAEPFVHAPFISAWENSIHSYCFIMQCIKVVFKTTYKAVCKEQSHIVLGNSNKQCVLQIEENEHNSPHEFYNFNNEVDTTLVHCHCGSTNFLRC